MIKGLETLFENPNTGDMQQAVWRPIDGGVTHRAVGSYVHRDIRLMWTACEKHDIPAGEAWLKTSKDAVDCLACISKSVSFTKG